jgi:hypothetical protein
MADVDDRRRHGCQPPLARRSNPVSKEKLRKYGKRAGYVVLGLVALDLLAGVATVAVAAWLR